MFHVELPPDSTHRWTTAAPPGATVQRCPICEGRGSIPVGFHEGREDPLLGRVSCKECGGRGMLVVQSWGGVSRLPLQMP